MNKDRKKQEEERQIKESIEIFLKLTNECVDIFLQQKLRDLTSEFSKNMKILEHTHIPPSNKLESVTCPDSITCLSVADNWL